ncbi:MULTISPECIES: ThiF family adenylyltransferase [Brevibacillus]|uniref:Thiazole biosynthesis adenylyltransferase ThiF n=1 Tax=Brevibacillus invocatus TaxID=173959 RepID=A0A3M8CGG4_9BACL|nr:MULTISPECIES: ThiF family adenylyltransferase [Brevibacillus]MCM3078991.1 ThiF family adenylyltransferase [Brevibacillus invocatus]MCM3432054.1 ThiF family adenylyltransferase [Brevibacillus invocatus]MDH4619664.1 ThiF family adenylyltransferase [Brevibacillus sp. AY1]RNB74792.1 thiazole biosynthesis adenylyltransferase ThiF [Brevibacillus invocatus]
MNTRYSRQILFAPIGRAGQEKLRQSRVAIVGMGALGTVLSNHMVRAGVGFVRLIDRDFVEPSNLQRQMLYDEADAAEHLPKSIAAHAKLSRINSEVEIEPIVADLTAFNAEQWLTDVDLVLDATDNFQVRYLVNDVCVKHGIPWVYGGAVSATGTFTAIRPGVTPCLRCLFPEAPNPGEMATCDTAGVIGPIIHIVASYQATEAFKILVGAEDAFNPNLETFDIWNNQHQQIKVANARRSDCPCCGQREFSFLEPDTQDGQAVSLCGRDTVQISPAAGQGGLDLAALEERLTPLGQVERNRFLLRLHVDPHTLVVFPDGRVLVQGTDDISLARTLHAKYIGA